MTKTDRFRDLAMIYLEADARERLVDHDDISEFVRTEAVRKEITQMLKEIRRKGLRELRGYRYHDAFRRTEPCTTCAERIKANELLTCPHPTEMQQWIRRAVRAMTPRETETVKRIPNRWALACFVMMCRSQVRHYYQFVPPSRDSLVHANGDRRVHLGAQRDGIMHEGTEIKVVDGGKTAFFDAFELRGWDRPERAPGKSQRLAFCQICAVTRDQPWFLVRKKMTKDGYERAPYALTATCPVCHTLEVEIPQGGKPKTWSYTMKRRMHGQVILTKIEFYRKRGQWYWASTNQQCHAVLSCEIDRRWRKGKALPEPAAVPDVSKLQQAAWQICEKAIAVTDYRRFTIEQRNQLRERFDKALAVITEYPLGTLDAWHRLRCAD